MSVVQFLGIGAGDDITEIFVTTFNSDEIDTPASLLSWTLRREDVPEEVGEVKHS